MELNLQDKHVLITGGSKGIGYACAAAFLAEGARVSLVSRNLEHLEAARQRLGAAVAGSHDRIHLHAADLQNPQYSHIRFVRITRREQVESLIASLKSYS